MQQATSEVLRFFDIEGRRAIETNDTSADTPLANGGVIRRYESIVLTPQEIERAIQTVSHRVKGSVAVLDGKVSELRRIGSQWVAFGAGGEIARARFAIFAAGRTGGSLLRGAGATPQEGKGIDLGVRIEFLDRRALQQLRERGPDAKILMGRTRTFCLNHPGIVYRYPFLDISIPGGIVADQSHPSANVGLLTRVSRKNEALDAVLRYLRTLPQNTYESASVVRGAPFQDKMAMLNAAYGPVVADELQNFAGMLNETGLMDWNRDHRIHFPLLDWHWDTFGIGSTHRTDQPGLYVAGDAAGHARGLLQAGISGWLAANELLADARE
ncbi:hypothetical protein [Mesorhizobium sp. M7A.F.Ca.MR.176.00.0.0]|uniref:hypothetical protein n=1 Tax=Mesorhizobium sp. M7A.F.Ca.MR.176.00.0.0 TaxID=2496776 RepID=UPI001FE0FBD2|nr:hypothetical protein [Mesorhizobium sp. M7A.F.Ca.MR.176.00.0.0]